MARSLAMVVALVLAATVLFLPATAQVADRSQPMRFALHAPGSAGCSGQCRALISASGAITADTPRDFERFARGRDLNGATMVLESDGGSVLGAIALGRSLRRLNIDTTVGHVIVSGDRGAQRATLSPKADCESMCAFVLLGGVHRTVPAQARVMVHQIWLGDRRDDPTASTYSAEDLALVQRDLGRLVQYTIEMGGSGELLDLSLRIPPWEPMHTLTVDEARRMRIATDAQATATTIATVAAAPTATLAQPEPRVTGSVAPTEISEREWALVDRSGVTALARRHPLTVEGEDIGTFDLIVLCGSGGGYDMSYIERRRDGDSVAVLRKLGVVAVSVGDLSAPLKVVTSERGSKENELVTYANGPAPAALVEAFAAAGSHSMRIETRSAGDNSAHLVTAIRLGNTGAEQNLPRLTASCGKPVGNRASLQAQKTGGLAPAK